MVAADQREALVHGLGDQQSVKRILVMLRQSSQNGGVLDVDGQQYIASLLASGAKPCGGIRLNGRREGKLP